MRERKSREAPTYSLRTCRRPGTGRRELQGTPDEDQASRQDRDPGTYLALRYA